MGATGTGAERLAPAVRPRHVLHLFGGPPHVTDGDGRREVPEGCQRLVVFVALRRQRVDRRHTAGVLWPAGDDGRAGGNLRSVLWRLKGAGLPLLARDKSGVWLREDVAVDVHVVTEWALRLVTGLESGADLAPQLSVTEALDLLPGWYDDWVLMERERLRQRVLHGLEAQCRALVRAGRYAEAVEAALTAISAEPLRESAQRALLEAHLAEGNWVEARRAFAVYRDLLADELGVEPSTELRRTLGSDPWALLAMS
jgi:DNA-binding SARP family transcriptional activator